MTQIKQEKMIELNHVAKNYVFSNILFIVLWCLFSWLFFFVYCLVGQVRMWTRGVFEISFMIIWWDVMMNFIIWIEIYILWALCYWAFLRNWVLRTNVIFGSLLRNQIQSILLLRYETQLWFVSFGKIL